MFRFNNWTPNTCNDLPECGQECHDLNVCSDNSTYIDRSGITRYIFATYDSDWNLTCMSGISCDQEVYDKPPKYNRHYGPCCWAVSVVGGSGTGACGQSCEKNYSYISNPTFLVDVNEENTGADVYIRHSFYGYGTGGCGTIMGQDFSFYKSSGLLGTITDLNCGLNGSGLSLTLDNFIQESSVPSLCNYDNVQVIYNGLYSHQECTKYWTGQYAATLPEFGFGYNNRLNLIDCIPIETIIQSGYPGCYTQDGDFIELGDPYNNSYKISLSDAIGWQVTQFELSGVVGYDTMPLASALKSSCLECETLNRAWLPGDWNGSSPYSPAAICCNCPDIDMCLNSWTLDLGSPSGYIILNSYHYGEVARWSRNIPSGCPIEVSGGPHNWEFNFHSSSSGDWNRCDFSSSNINLTYDSNLIDYDDAPDIDCDNLADNSTAPCSMCMDGTGPNEFLVTITVQNPRPNNMPGNSTECPCYAIDLEGSWILQKVKTRCKDQITVRNGVDCPCAPCSSGQINPAYSCTWEYEDLSHLYDTSIYYNLGAGVGYFPRSGLCPCYNSRVVDAAGPTPQHILSWCRLDKACGGGYTCARPGSISLSRVTVSGIPKLRLDSTYGSTILDVPYSGSSSPCGTPYAGSTIFDCSYPINVTLTESSFLPYYDGMTITVESL